MLSVTFARCHRLLCRSASWKVTIRPRLLSTRSTMSPNSDLYCELAEIPVYSGAQFILSSSKDARKSPGDEHTTIRVTTSVEDHLKNTYRSLVKYISVSPSDAYATPAQDLSDAVATFPSPSGALLAVLRESTADGGEKKRFVEVWRGSSLQAVSEVTKLHGSFYAQDFFASSSFS
ncbi:hypothetical protein SCHPADRAFT_253490, partial [Schizopora paradoxa]